MDEVLASQAEYYRRRAGEYDVTAYGDVAAARACIARLVAEMDPSGAETYLPGGDEIVERQLRDGSRYRIVKNFVDPELLERRLRGLGWECRIRPEVLLRYDDGSDWVWVCGEARPVT